LFPYCPGLLLAFLAPLAIRARQHLPGRKMRLIRIYCLLFVSSCAANQYSWLQPAIGFR
jgi:hypothetical protein